MSVWWEIRPAAARGVCRAADNVCKAVCAGAGWAAERHGASRASAAVLGGCPSVVLAADIKGYSDARCLPLRFVPALQEAFTDTTQAAGTAQPVEQL